MSLTLAACAGSGGGGGAAAAGAPDSSSQPSSDSAAEPQPTAEATDPTVAPSVNSRSNPAISVARLPVGGGSELQEGDPTLQCAQVSWIVNSHGEIPTGTAVEITKVLFTPHVFEVVRDGCGSPAPNCVGYIFRSSAQRCDLLVRVVGKIPENTSPSVGFAGLVYCPHNDSQSCRELVAALAHQPQISVQLTVPPPPEASSNPGPTTDPASTSGPLPTAEPGTT